MELPTADLELSLSRRDADSYAVDLRFSPPDSAADIRLAGVEPALARFDAEQLRALALDPAAYGRVLSEALFADPALRQAFAQARASAAALDAAIRMRLQIGPGAAELHALRWETLGDPEAERPLLTDERLHFSRYLAADDWRPVRLRPRGALRALAAVAAPADLARFRLAPIDAAAELERAKAGLGDIALNALAGPGQVTLSGIVDGLRDGVDILYLVCHGALVNGAPTLWLEDAAGAVAPTSGAELAQRIRELEQRPRLVLLASCESAGDGAGAALGALGPLLAAAGVPAVVAMQGKVTMTTATDFLAAFFRELRRDGQIDRAMSVARGAVRAQSDSWMPALFMRLRAGRIWYVPGFADQGNGFEQWPAIVRSIRRGQATPIIGGTLSEATLGPPSALATRWAARYAFPLAPHARDELENVAQYLSVNQSLSFPHELIADEIRAALTARFGPALGPAAASDDVYDLLAAVGALQRARNPAEPYRVLAEQPFPIYVTSAYHSLLSEALRAAGKDPVVEFCRWTPELERLPTIYDDEPRYLPSVERPLVFHLFGILAESDSLVLAEDDYFDFMIRVARTPDLVPLAVREALADSALLLLGYRIDAWDFRVLYRSLLQPEGRARRSKYANVAGQVAPDEDYFLLPDKARRYFERYFTSNDISIFWGSVEDFTRDLLAHLAETPAAPATERPASRRR